MNPVLGEGTFLNPEAFDPHATIEPSPFRPRLWAPPAATAMNPVLGEGTFLSPEAFDPHATIAPSDLRPRL